MARKIIHPYPPILPLFAFIAICKILRPYGQILSQSFRQMARGIDDTRW
jgi:hypothetical protein